MSPAVYALLLTLTGGVQSDLSPDPRMSLNYAVATVAQQIEAGDLDTLLRQSVHPDDLERATRFMSFDDLVQSMRGAATRQLIYVFRAVRDREPQFSPDGQTAVFDVSDLRLTQRRVTFRRNGLVWYLQPY